MAWNINKPQCILGQLCCMIPRSGGLLLPSKALSQLAVHLDT